MILSFIKRVAQILLLLLVPLALIVLVVGGMLGISFVQVARTAPDINPETILMDLNENSEILDSEGNLIEEISAAEYREIVPYERIPKHLVDAFVAIEDERFWSHNGIDLQGIGSSLLQNIAAGDIVRGGSTITQQLVKNIYLSPDKQWERKITELYLSYQVDDKLTKEEIMEAYLNRIFLGQYAYGVQAGAQMYFSKDVEDLTIAESATIAGIVQAPSSNSLFSTYYPQDVPGDAKVLGEVHIADNNFIAVLNENAFERKNLVMKNMHEQGLITDSEYEQARVEDVASHVKPGTKKHKEVSSLITSLIRRQAVNIIMEEKNMSREDASTLLYNGGLQIKTTIDWDMQAKLEETYSNLQEILQRRSAGENAFLAQFETDENGNILNRGSDRVAFFKKSNFIDDNNRLRLTSRNYDFDEEGNLIFTTERMTSDGEGIYLARFYDIDENNNLRTYRASSLRVPSEQIESLGRYEIKINKAFLDENSNFYEIDDEGRLFISNEYFTAETKGTIQPQSSTVIIDQYTGSVKAMIGSREQSEDDTLDRATSVTRSPASSLKPIVDYAPALENGFTAATVLDDLPFELTEEETPWPRNVYEGYRGLMSMREALFRSSNGAAVQMLNRSGIENAKQYLEGFGLIDSKNPENDNFITAAENPRENDENLALAIGAMSRGFTPYEMAQAYSALANEGKRYDATVISSIETKNGDVIYNMEENQPVQVISKENTWILTDILTDTHERFRNNSKDGIQFASKTGTSNDNMDYWFSAYNPYYTSSTWIGFDNNNISLTGGSTILYSLYDDFMNKMLEDKEDKIFEMPENIIEVEIDTKSGDKPSRMTKESPMGDMTGKEYFVKGTEPTRESTIWVNLSVDSRNDLLASSKTPSYARTNKIFLKRDPAYDPAEFNNITPDDWQYEAPTKYSDLGAEARPTRTTRTTYSDGSVVERIEESDGTIIETTTYPNGRVVRTVTSPNGQTRSTVIREGSTNPAPEPDNTPEPEEPEEPEDPEPEEPEDPEPEEPEDPEPEEPEDPEPEPGA